MKWSIYKALNVWIAMYHVLHDTAVPVRWSFTIKYIQFTLSCVGRWLQSTGNIQNNINKYSRCHELQESLVQSVTQLFSRSCSKEFSCYWDKQFDDSVGGWCHESTLWCHQSKLFFCVLGTISLTFTMCQYMDILHRIINQFHKAYDAFQGTELFYKKKLRYDTS